MPNRTSASARRTSTRRNAPTVDVVMLTPHGRRLSVLLQRVEGGKSKERWALPWEAMRADESIEESAARIARNALGSAPSLVEQVAAYGDGRRHPSGAPLSVAFLALVAAGGPASLGGATAWFPIDDVPPIAPRQRAMLDGALDAVRARLEQAPVAFRLLPATFTLSELQEIYEILLGRRLHKASFRRALHAAWLVEPTDEWRSEGRGRPAQLFRYAPKKRRSSRRGVRFEGVEL
ncbi:MAG TPA: NUDIX domain-containing protein [Gemmatimonadaceae bacterium]|nr:NUDIX domain-containing protein [Gemmatimonadaceae bacterium]